MRPTATDRSGFDPLSLDPSTAGRLLDGLAADDAPAAYAPLAQLLAAACGPAEADELAGESAAVAAFAAVGPQPVADPAKAAAKGSIWERSRARRSLKIAVATVVGGLTLTTGLAAAGALPGAAQMVASEALAKVGISVPNPNDKAGAHPDSRGSSADHPEAPDSTTTESGGSEDTGGPKDGTHGAEVSGTARTTDAEGRDKGAEVSGVASDGKSRAGDQPAAPTDPGVNEDTQRKERTPEATPEAPVEPPAPKPDADKGGRP